MIVQPKADTTHTLNPSGPVFCPEPLLGTPCLREGPPAPSLKVQTGSGYTNVSARTLMGRGVLGSDTTLKGAHGLVFGTHRALGGVGKMGSARLPRPQKRRQLFPRHPTQTRGWPVQSGTWNDTAGSL